MVKWYASRRLAAAAIAAAAAAAITFAALPAFADSPRGLVSKGNRQYNRKAFGEALGYYDKASVKSPESPIVAFNRGAALYKQGDYEKAREHFKDAAAKTKSLPFEARAWYNLGNVAFREGERQEDSDLRKALASLEESVRHYVTALEKDPDLDEAAENLEIARLKIKDLLDKIQKQQQQGGDQSQQQQQQQQEGEEQQQGEGERQEGEERQEGAEDREEKRSPEEQQKEDEQAAPEKPKEKPLESDKTARQILDEERENRKERQRQESRSKYRPVGKDW